LSHRYSPQKSQNSGIIFKPTPSSVGLIFGNDQKGGQPQRTFVNRVL
jgi:hypothetical protein